MQSDIRVFKLVTGEELIAEVEKYEDDVFYLLTPYAIGVNQQTGNLVFVPYLQYTNAAAAIQLHERHVMLTAEPVDSIYNDYLDSTRKIKVPKQSIIQSIN